ncbi:hypothetical protein Ndes2437B_g06215 [Nannochloris sp. 'desiccata']
MAPKRNAGADAPETLDSASAHDVEGLLNRVNKRRNTSNTPFPAVNGGILPPPRRRHAAAAPVCGAPAAAAEEKQELPHKDDNKTPDTNDAPVDLTQQEEEEIELDQGSGSEDDWEDIEEEGEDRSEPFPSKNKQPRQGITINLGGRGGSAGIDNEEDEAGPSRIRRRQAFAKEDRETARLVHRSHLLCLLGRGLLYDAAADDPLLQATAFSLLPSSLVELISKDVSSVDEQVQQKALEEATKWFRVNFTLLKTSSLQPPAENEDEIGAAIAQAKGLEGISSQLLLVVERRCGTAEELSTIFAALLRSLGCLIRTVRLLEPSSLKPGDALRQQEQALKNYMKRKTPTHQSQDQQRQSGGSKKVNVLAKAAADLLDGTERQRQERYKEHVAAQLGLPDSRALKFVAGGGARAPSIELDPRKLKVGNNGSFVGKKRQVRTAIGPTDEEKNEKEKGKEAPKPSAKKKTVPAKNKTSMKEEEEKKPGTESKCADTTSTTTTTIKAHQHSKNTNTKAHDDFCDGGVLLDSVNEAHPISRKKRRGDVEFERELEVAMAATAFERPESAEAVEKTNPAAEDTKSLQSGGRKNQRGGGSTARGAAFGSHQDHVGRYWVEVYCGSTTSGRWVHVCPISGWIDRAEDVEGLAPRGQSLAYVVAFGGHGGAKDVTRRYASSFLSAEKQREGAWWESVLRPLRTREVAALHNAAAAAAAGGPGGGNMNAIDTRDSNTAPNGLNLPAFGTNRSGPSLPPPKQQQKIKTNKQKPSPALSLAALREDKELEQRAAAERLTLPTTIDGFKNHATFILSRHITKYQTLVPGSKVLGTHKGEAYYSREDVGEVHTAEKWKRIGREVLVEELSTPAKKIKKRKMPQMQQRRGSRFSYLDTAAAMAVAGSMGSGAGGSINNNINAIEEEEGVDEELSDFYGIWQTKPWVPDAAVNGRVPKNERGNVEVPPFASALPSGTVHIQLPGLGPICRKLGVDYAPALTGFDIRGGRSVPSIEGIVVCTEHEDAVRAAFEEETARRAQQAKDKRMVEAEKSWRELLRALLTRVRLANAYSGNNNGENGSGIKQPETAEGEAAAMLAHGAGQAKLKKGSGKAGARPRASRGEATAIPVAAENAVGDDFVDVKVEEI